MEPSGDEVKRLQDCINDLMGILALASVWSGREPDGILGTLLDALISLLRLDFVYAWLNDSFGGAPIEMVRSARSPNLKVPPLELARQLKTWLGDNPCVCNAVKVIHFTALKMSHPRARCETVFCSSCFLRFLNRLVFLPRAR
jgi:hypothetical protein